MFTVQMNRLKRSQVTWTWLGVPFVLYDKMTPTLPPAEAAEEEFPYILVTGRVYHQYHTGTMTRRSDLANREYSRPLIEVHPDDARKLHLRSGLAARGLARADFAPAKPKGTVGHGATFSFNLKGGE